MTVPEVASPFVRSARTAARPTSARLEPDPPAHEIQSAGGMLLDLNRHELYYQFDFTAKYEITEEDSRQQEDLDVLPDLKTLSIDVDFIEPGTGPDGNIEHHTGITLP